MHAVVLASNDVPRYFKAHLSQRFSSLSHTGRLQGD
jgi:hypothetical protein